MEAGQVGSHPGLLRLFLSEEHDAGQHGAETTQRLQVLLLRKLHNQPSSTEIDATA
jgi:hypothetical protein